MGYPRLSRRTAFAAVLEVTPGAKTLPTMADNAIRLLDVPSYEEVYLAENTTDEIVTGKLGKILLAQPGSRAMRIRGRSPLANTGAVPAAGPGLPELDSLLIGAGYARTLTLTPGSESVAYVPTDDPSVGATTTVCCKLQMDGKEFVLYHGVVEEFQITADAAGFPSVSWSIVGIMDPPTEKDVPDATTIEASYFPIWKGANSLLVNGVATAKIFARSFTLNLGVTASPRIDANSADGHAGYLITDRTPELDIRVERTALADWNVHEDWRQRTSRKVTILLGALQPQFSKVEIVVGDGRIRSVQGADDNALRYMDVKLLAATPLSGTDPEVGITFK